MKRRVMWSRDALDDLKQQLVYIAAQDPVAAEKIFTHIRLTGDALSDFATGHQGRVTGTYEKSVRNLPYIIAYTFAVYQGNSGDTILISIGNSGVGNSGIVPGTQY